MGLEDDTRDGGGAGGERPFFFRGLARPGFVEALTYQWRGVETVKLVRLVAWVDGNDDAVLLRSLRIGREVSFIDPVPLVVFHPAAFGLQLELPGVAPGATVRIEVTTSGELARAYQVELFPSSFAL